MALDYPKSLFDQCLHCLIKNVDYLITLKNNKSLSLPNQVCDVLFNLYQCKSSDSSTSKFVSVFENPKETPLKRITLMRDFLSDYEIEVLLNHNLEEIKIKEEVWLPHASDLYFNKNGASLKKLYFNNFIFCNSSLNLPNLEELFVTDFNNLDKKFILSFKNLRHLHLYIKNEMHIKEFSFLLELPDLRSLTLQSRITQDGFTIIRKLYNLQYLNIAFCEKIIYETPFLIMSSLIEDLPNLMSLDISGTNLDYNITEALELRRNTPLEYLGLFSTYYQAWKIKGLPAKQIAGNENMEQLLVAGMAHFESGAMMHVIFNEMVEKLDELVEKNQYDLILKFSLQVLERHPRLVNLCSDLCAKIMIATPLAFEVKRILFESVIIAAIIKSTIKSSSIRIWTAEDLFYDMALMKDFLFIETRRSESFLVTMILNMADETQREWLARNLLDDMLKQDNFEDSYNIFWYSIWLLVRNNLVSNVLFVEKGGIGIIQEYLRRLGFLKDNNFYYADWEKKSIIYALMVLISLIQYESIVSHYFTNDVLSDLLLGFLNLSTISRKNGRDYKKCWLDEDYTAFWDAFYCTGYIFLKLISYGEDKWNPSTHKREYILNKIAQFFEMRDRIARLDFIKEDLYQLIWNLFKMQNMPECVCWAVWGISFFPDDVQDKYLMPSSGEEGLKFLREIAKTNSYPKSVIKMAKELIEFYPEGFK